MYYSITEHKLPQNKVIIGYNMIYSRDILLSPLERQRPVIV